MGNRRLSDRYREFVTEFAEMLKALLPNKINLRVNYNTGTYMLSRLNCTEKDIFGYTPMPEYIYDPYPIFKNIENSHEQSIYDVLNLDSILGDILSGVVSDESIYDDFVSGNVKFRDIKNGVLPVIMDHLTDTSDISQMLTAESSGFTVGFYVYIETSEAEHAASYAVPVTYEIAKALNVSLSQLADAAIDNLSTLKKHVTVYQIDTEDENAEDDIPVAEGAGFVNIFHPVIGIAYFMSDEILQKLADIMQGNYYIYAIGKTQSEIAKDDDSLSTRLFLQHLSLDAYEECNPEISISPDMIRYDADRKACSTIGVYDCSGSRMYSLLPESLIEGFIRFNNTGDMKPESELDQEHKVYTVCVDLGKRKKQK